MVLQLIRYETITGTCYTSIVFIVVRNDLCVLELSLLLADKMVFYYFARGFR